MNKSTETSSMNNEQLARRKLLKMASYVPPAILGVMIGGNKIAEAENEGGGGGSKKCKGGGTIVISANGNACCPCVKKPTGKKCKKAQCKLGNTASCKQEKKKKKGGEAKGD